MSDHDLPSSESDTMKGEFRCYLSGLLSALILTAAAFAIVAGKLLSPRHALLALSALAAVQIGVHLRYFLHIDLKKSHRDDLQLVLFTGLIVTLMVGGTLWILSSQYDRMM